MSVSTTTFGPKVWAAPLTDFPQFRGDDKREVYFDEHNPFSLEKTTAQIRTRMIFEHLEEIPDSQKQAQSPLQALLSRTLHIVPCISGLVGGTFGSLITQHPLPILLGFSQCFPQASAQQKVGGEFQVNNFTNETESVPSVTRLSNGNFVVAWTSSGLGIARDTYGQIFHQNGSKIGNAFQLNTYTPDDQTQPYVTDLDNGNFVAAWTSNNQDGDRGGIFGQLFVRNGSKIGNEFQINTVTSDVQAGASIALLDNGNFIVTWHSAGQDGSGYGVFGQIFTHNGTKLGSAFRANTFTNDWQWIPSVLGLRNSHFVVTWAGMGPRDANEIQGQLFASSGTKIGNSFEVNSNYQLIQSSSKERMTRIHNHFVVTWHSEVQDGSWDSFGQLFDENTTKIGTEFQVNTFTNASQTRPSVASFTNGNFVVVWHDNTQDGDGWGVYGQLFDENAAKLGNEFQIHTNIRNYQKNPSVATLRDGNFVVTWGSENQDRNLTAVFCQIFHDNITYPPTSSSTSSSSSINPSSSSTKSSSFIPSSSSTKISLSSKRSTEISSTSPPSKRRFLWLWFLLGVGGGTICLGAVGYLLRKFRNKEGDVLETELGKKKEPNSPPTEEHYQRTPDHVRPEDERSIGQYGRLADASTFEGEYQLTPDHVRPENEGSIGQYGRLADVSTFEGEYQLTPDHVGLVEE